MIERFRAPALALALSLGAVTCRNGTEPGESQTWAADLIATQQVLFMTLHLLDSEVTGEGLLASLTNPGGEQSLTLTGTRRADSLEVTYQRQGAEPFRFTGRYAGAGLAGVLDGAEFVQVPVLFKSR